MNCNMKRLAYLPMLLSLLLGSCTLMMENVDTEEAEQVNLEEVGFDEPYTQRPSMAMLPSNTVTAPVCCIRRP